MGVKELATNMVWPIVWHIDANDIVDPATHQLGLVESLRLVAQFCTTPRGLEVLSVPFAWFWICQVLAMVIFPMLARHSRMYRDLPRSLKGECASSFVSTIHCSITGYFTVRA